MDIEETRKQAQDENTAPEILVNLAENKDYLTRQYIAENPNTPTEILLKLGTEFPREVLDNPIFDLLLLENPNLISDIPIKTLRSLIKQDNVPESFVVECAERESDKETLLGITSNPVASRNIIEKLTKSKFPEVAEAAKLHINWSGEMKEGWQELAEEKIKIIRPLYSGAATRIKHLQHEQPYLSILAKLGWIPNFLISHWNKHWNKWEILRDIANSVNTSPITLTELEKNNNPRIRRLIAINPNTPIETLENLVDDDEQGGAFGGEMQTVKMGLLENPNAPPIVLDKLAEHQNYQAREAVAKHHNCSVHTLNKLAEDESIEVCYQVAINPNTTSLILKKIFDRCEKIYIKKAIARHPNCSTGLLEKLLNEENKDIRYAILNNYSTPSYLIEKLALNESRKYIIKEGVRQLLNRKHLSLISLYLYFNNIDICIKNKKSESFQEKINRLHREYEQKERIKYWQRKEMLKKANNPDLYQANSKQTSLKTLKQLLQHKNTQIRRAVANNPKISIDIIKQIDSDSKILENAHYNSQISETLLKYLLVEKGKHCEPALKNYLNNNFNKYLNWIAKGYTKCDYLIVRLIILLNNYLTVEIFKSQSNSVYWLERYAIAQNSNTPVDIIHKLACDANKIVRAAAKDNLAKKKINV